MMDYYTLYRLMRPRNERAAARARRAMAPFAASYAASIPGKSPGRIGRVTGSFVYSRPPDYEGAPSLDWAAADWSRELLRLRSLGIDTVVYQGAMAETIRGRLSLYYEPSAEGLARLSAAERRLRARAEILPRLDALFDAADGAGVAVHLGLYNVVKGWYGLPRPSFIEEILGEELAVAADLAARYATRKSFAGWYVSPEIIYGLHGRRRDIDFNAFLRRLTAPLREAAPAARIGISPASFFRAGRMKEVEDFWIRAFAGSGLDTLYPQDSVGVLAVRPEDAPALWESWARVAAASGLELWANCEAFERKNFGEELPLDSAPFPRFLAQLEAAGPHAKKILTWEAMYFLNPAGPPGGAALEAGYREFFGLGK